VSAATVSNNGFEKPAVGTDDYYAFQYNPVTVADTQNWTFTGNAGVTGNNSGFTSGNATAPDGTQVAFLQTDDSSISQSISFPTSGIYTLSTVTAQRGNWNIGPQRANVYLDDVLVGMASPTSATYEKVSLAISASAGAHVLSFKGVAGNDCTLFIDQVTLVLQQ